LVPLNKMYFYNEILMEMEISLRQLKNKIKNLIIRPVSFWKNEKLEQNGTQQLLAGYFLPLVLLVGAAEFAGQLIRGSGFYLMYPFMLSLREVLLFLLMYGFSVFITRQLIRPFGGRLNLAVVRKLVAYSLIPVMMITVVTNLIPFLYVLQVLGFYGFFVFMAGVEVLVDLPERKRTRYILIAILANFFIFNFLSIFLSKLVASFI
jgi:hypothetical protein